MTQLINEIFASPMSAMFIIFSIILLECLLSIDNAAVLATFCLDLPPNQRKKALTYGIIGAYVFRGLALLFASFIIKIWFLKPIGGIYLIYLAYSYFKGKQTETIEDDYVDKKKNWLYRSTVGYIGVFWSTVAVIELMDMAFSIDNIFAVVAFSNNIILIIFGVFIGIICMRFVAQGFVKLIEKYTFLENAAFVVIGVLGIKLTLSLITHFIPSMKWLDGEATDFVVSGITLLIFIVPMVYIKFFKAKVND